MTGLSLLVATATLLGSYGIFGLVFYLGLPPELQEKILFILIGGLLSHVGTVVNYCFGSSAGSAKKNELLADKICKDKKP